MSSQNTDSRGHVAIIGAGLMGRMLAVHLSDDHWQVDLYDQDSRAAERSCAYTGAGMLAPVSELDRADPAIAHLGDASMDLWPTVLDRLPTPVDFQRAGTVLVAHAGDRSHFEQTISRIHSCNPFPTRIRRLPPHEWRDTEPALAEKFTHAWFVEGEGHIDNRQLLRALAAAIDQRGIHWHERIDCTDLSPGAFRCGDEVRRADWVLDCRGTGAMPDLPDLRGVRGELLYLHAPEVDLRHPVRLAHPRYPLYIVPRADHQFVIGATEIESDDQGPVTVRSALELLSAAYSLHTGFTEARIVEQCANCRPAYPDHFPRITVESGLVRVNGLYRHGFLLAPLVVEHVRQSLFTGKASPLSNPIPLQHTAP